MIIEAILIGLMVGYLNDKRNAKDIRDLGIQDFWLTILAGLLFFLLMKAVLYTNNPFLLKNFPLLHSLCLFLMAFGLLKGEKYFGKIVSSLGFFLNGLVVLLNSKMPISIDALRKIGDFRTIKLLEENRVITHMKMEGTKLNFLADIFAYKSFFGPKKVISIGDFFIALGFGVLLFSYIKNMVKRERNDRLDK